MTRYIDPRLKVLQHADRLAAIQAGRTPAPVNVEIDLSNRCSLGCAWCHFAYTHTRGPLAGAQKPAGATSGGDLFNTDLLLRVGVDLANAGVRSTTWTGGGEPTLHPDFDRIVTAWPLPQGIYTHGGHIDRGRARLLKHRLSWVYVSLDECNPADYKNSKGVDRFNDVLDGVRRLVAADGGATIGVGFLLHKGNYRRVFDMTRLALEQLGADYVQFRPAVRYLTDKPAVPAEDAAWIQDALVYLQHPTLANNPAVYAETDRFRQYLDWTGHGYGTCYWSQLQAVITPDGRVWTCVNRREYAGSELGNLNNRPFSAIWARVKAHCVDDQCRVMCRGHMANQTLNYAMGDLGHREFI